MVDDALAVASRSALASRPTSNGRFVAFTDMPLILTIEEVAALYRTAASTIRRLVRANEFEPPPFAVSPYRWRRADIERDIEQRDSRALVREHVKKTRRRRRRQSS